MKHNIEPHVTQLKDNAKLHKRKQRQTVQVRLSTKWRDQLRLLAKARKTTMSKLLDTLVGYYVKQCPDAKNEIRTRDSKKKTKVSNNGLLADQHHKDKRF